MFKRFFLCLVVCFLLLPTVTVLADVVILPPVNDFYAKNRTDIIRIDRSRFKVESPDGYVAVRKEPGWDAEKIISYWDDEEIRYGNGAELFIEHVYICDGEYWGLEEFLIEFDRPGWFPMDHLLAVYTTIDFDRENRSSIYTYEGNLDALYAADRIVLWQWPGSDREKRVVDNGIWILYDAEVLRVFMDGEGREWGYVGLDYVDRYYYDETVEIYNSWMTQHLESWICLSDLGNNNIFSFYPAPAPIKWTYDGVREWTHIDVTDNSSEYYSLSSINKARQYGIDETFTDVDETAWYKEAVAAAYEYGFINGKGDSVFDPYGQLTVEEALIIASRIHAYYKYGLEEGERLLAMYGRADYYYGAYNYCHVEGLIRENSNDNWDRIWNFYEAITRAQMASLCSKILQPKDMAIQNTVSSLPDVNEDSMHYTDIKLCYEVGIVCGVDALESFNPTGNITRAEASTIFMNLIDTTKRHSGRTYG